MPPKDAATKFSLESDSVLQQKRIHCTQPLCRVCVSVFGVEAGLGDGCSFGGMVLSHVGEE